MTRPHPALVPGTIGGLELRNRIVKSATYEGMSPGGIPGSALLRHHARLAAGGVGLTTVAYCGVSESGRTFPNQLVMTPEILKPLRALTDAVHAEGAAASLQLGHCGGFTKNPTTAPKGPESGLNPYGLMAGKGWIRRMDESDLLGVVQDFAVAASRALEAGFDCIELHLGHGYLLSQFLSPALNRRRDGWGGDLEGRLRLSVEVLRAVRGAVGQGVPLLAKINLSDGFRGGLEIDESVEIARRLENEGIDGLVMSGGFVSRSPFYLMRGKAPVSAMVAAEPSRLQKLAIRLFAPWLLRSPPFEELFFMEEARRIREAVSVPLVLLGGVCSGVGARQALDAGFDFVAMARALIADPGFVEALERDPDVRSRCTHCNACVGEMDLGGVRCVLDDVEGAPLPHPATGYDRGDS